MAIRTVEDLQSALTTDLKWRTQELFTWEQIAIKARKQQIPGLMRGGLALLYAHWEGYIKTAGSRYLEYVSGRRLKLGQLRPELAAVATRADILRLAAEKNPEAHTAIVHRLWDGLDTDAGLPYDTSTIRTYANLNFKTFRSIMHSLGCDANRHAIHRIHIDERLLGVRNEIAHGREEYVDIEDWLATRAIVENILKDVRTQLGNAAAQEEFKRPAT